MSCGWYLRVYIGQIGRSSKKIITEHKRSVINGRSDSTYAENIEEVHYFRYSLKILNSKNKGL